MPRKKSKIKASNKVLTPDTDKRKDIVAAYAEIADAKGYVTMNDMVDAGYSKDVVTHHFRNLSRLNRAAREAHPSSFFDIHVDELLGPENLEKMKRAIGRNKRFIITTAVTGCKAFDEAVSSISAYCSLNDAHALVLVASDPAHNHFAPGARYGTIDKQLVENPNMSIVVCDVSLNTNICISTVKLAAKQTDPSTSMGRIASTKGTFIFASPKQRLKAVPVSNRKYPHFTMTTGAITHPDYDSDNYMSQRSAFLAEYDHVMGGLIVEIEDDDRYHFRQFQIDEDGSFIDLGIRYQPDGKTQRERPEAFVLGDWHSGFTDPLAKKAWLEVCGSLSVKRLVMHDMFDGRSINHHERQDVVSRAVSADRNMDSLADEVSGLVKDIDELSDIVDELVIVKSNHDEFLDRYLRSGYYVKDPKNHRYSLDLAAATMDGHDPLQHAVNTIGVKNPNKVNWLSRDEDFKIAGIQLGAHGDLGANGARGTIQSIERAYGHSVTGHAHTPEILRGAWQVGTSSLLKLSYNKGPSSWMHASCLVYENGSRQMINAIEGNWVLKSGLSLFSKSKPKKKARKGR